MGESSAQAMLEVTNPPDFPRLVAIDASPYLVGRGTSNHLQLADRNISRRCASVTLSGDEYAIEDLGQRGGIYVNGKRIFKENLRNGDAIQLGYAHDLQIIFRRSLTVKSSDDELLSTATGMRPISPFSLLRRKQQQKHEEWYQETTELYEQTLALAQELETAHDIQQALMPQGFNEYGGFQVDGISLPCRELGGDFFCISMIDSDRLTFLVADVSGKGLAAAIVASTMQGIFTGLSTIQSPEFILNHVHRFLCQHSELNHFATLFFGVITRSGKLEYINAGHPSPFLLHAGCVEATFAAGSHPIGLLPETEFMTDSYQITPGDTLVLFTDGIFEAENVSGEQYGLDRLQNVIETHANAAVDEVKTAILSSVTDFIGQNEPTDDLTLLVLRCPGAD